MEAIEAIWNALPTFGTNGTPQELIVELWKAADDREFAIKCWDCIKPEANTYGYSDPIWAYRMHAVIRLVLSGKFDKACIMHWVENHAEMKAADIHL